MDGCSKIVRDVDALWELYCKDCFLVRVSSENERLSKRLVFEIREHFVMYCKRAVKLTVAVVIKIKPVAQFVSAIVLVIQISKSFF